MSVAKSLGIISRSIGDDDNKLCRKCSTRKHFSEFHWLNRRRKIKASYCKACACTGQIKYRDKPVPPTETKVCRMCRRAKPLLVAFYRDMSCPGGFMRDCQTCYLEREHKAANKAELDKIKRGEVRRRKFVLVDANTPITCTSCSQSKPPGEFYLDWRKANGRQSWCKVCTSERLATGKAVLAALRRAAAADPTLTDAQLQAARKALLAQLRAARRV